MPPLNAALRGELHAPTVASASDLCRGCRIHSCIRSLQACVDLAHTASEHHVPNVACGPLPRVDAAILVLLLFLWSPSRRQLEPKRTETRRQPPGHAPAELDAADDAGRPRRTATRLRPSCSTLPAPARLLMTATVAMLMSAYGTGRRGVLDPTRRERPGRYQRQRGHHPVTGIPVVQHPHHCRPQRRHRSRVVRESIRDGASFYTAAMHRRHDLLDPAR